MSKNGADIIEIGIPFSDPIAEGVVIQEADLRSLSAGTTTDKIFDMVKRIRPQDNTVLRMTYMNPIFICIRKDLWQSVGVRNLRSYHYRAYEEKHGVYRLAENTA